MRSFSTTTTTLSTHAKKKIAVALSGGVDSSVAAFLLLSSSSSQQQQQQQCSKEDILGIHMSNWDYHQNDDNDNYNYKNGNTNNKCWEQDWKDAQAVAQHLQIPIVHASFQSEYWTQVFEPYCDQLNSSTPNPDIDCNRYIKFGVLKEYLQQRYQIDTLATGHYARLWDPTKSSAAATGLATAEVTMPWELEQAIEKDSTLYTHLFQINAQQTKKPVLLAAKDTTKDQSYFLSGVSGDAFRNVIFPLGDYFKTKKFDNNNNNHHQQDTNTTSTTNTTTTTTTTQLQQNNLESLSVREIAHQAQLPTAQKRDSMGICFIGKHNNNNNNKKRHHGSFMSEFMDDSTTSITQKVIECRNIENGHLIATYHPGQEPQYSSLLFATVGQGAKLSGASQKWFVVHNQKASMTKDTTTKESSTITQHEDLSLSSILLSSSSSTTTNTLWICPGTHHPSLYSDTILVQDMNWIAGCPPPSQTITTTAATSLSTTTTTTLVLKGAQCRIRHLQPLVDCDIYYRVGTSSSSGGGSYYEIQLHQPLRGIAPGQICAIYYHDGLVCLGGGPITHRGPSYMELQKDLPTLLHPSGHNDLSTTTTKTTII